MRFLANTTLGVAGFFDVANSWFNLPMRYHQDFTVILHKWELYKKSYASPYIVWPIFGLVIVLMRCLINLYIYF